MYFLPKSSESDSKMQLSYSSLLYPEVRFLQTVYFFLIYLYENPLTFLQMFSSVWENWEKGVWCCPGFSHSNQTAAFIGRESWNKQLEHYRVHRRQKVLHGIRSSQGEWVVMSKIELQIFSSFLLPTGRRHSFAFVFPICFACGVLLPEN